MPCLTPNIVKIEKLHYKCLYFYSSHIKNTLHASRTKWRFYALYVHYVVSENSYNYKMWVCGSLLKLGFIDLSCFHNNLIQQNIYVYISNKFVSNVKSKYSVYLWIYIGIIWIFKNTSANHLPFGQQMLELTLSLSPWLWNPAVVSLREKKANIHVSKWMCCCYVTIACAELAL